LFPCQLFLLLFVDGLVKTKVVISGTSVDRLWEQIAVLASRLHGVLDKHNQLEPFLVLLGLAHYLDRVGGHYGLGTLITWEVGSAVGGQVRHFSVIWVDLGLVHKEVKVEVNDGRLDDGLGREQAYPRVASLVLVL